MMRLFLVAVFLTCAIIVDGVFLEQCELPKALKKEIRGYQAVVNRIIDYVVRGNAKGEVYKSLVDFVDKFGARLSGTPVLERAIAALKNIAVKNKLNVSTQNVQVPYWKRGEESVTMLKPRKAKILVVGLGSSVSTPKKGIEAPVLVVRTFKELRRKAAKVHGKIVVMLPKWEGYHDTVVYRFKSASEAAKLGAVAVLIRSMTDLNMGVPHTGQQNYKAGDPKIPAACISAEDAEMFFRMQQRNQPIKLHLNLQSTDHGMKPSKNLMADVLGRESPKKYVFVSGHMDSWDVGVGALDDGGGAFISLFTPIILNKLGLKARRTVRALLFTAEEQGLFGAHAYKKSYDPNDIVLAMESDEGVFNPTGLLMHGSHKARCIVHEVLQLLHPINATTLETHPGPGSDITVWAKDTPVPTAALRNDNERYFWWHHSFGDRVEVMNSDEMDRSLALFAAVSYVVADLSVPLPRDNGLGQELNQIPLRSPYSQPVPDKVDSEEDERDEEEANLGNLSNNPRSGVPPAGPSRPGPYSVYPPQRLIFSDAQVPVPSEGWRFG